MWGWDVVMENVGTRIVEWETRRCEMWGWGDVGIGNRNCGMKSAWLLTCIPC